MHSAKCQYLPNILRKLVSSYHRGQLLIKFLHTTIATTAEQEQPLRTVVARLHRLDALPVTQTTVSEHYTDRIFLHTKLNEINCSLQYFWQQPCIIYALSRLFSRRETKCSCPWFRHRKLTRDFVASTTTCWQL